MPDPLRKVSPGEKLPRFPAALFNDLVEVAADHRARGQMGQRDAGKQYAEGNDLRVLNDTGSTLSRFGIVRVAAPFIGTDDNEPEAFANPNVTGLAPLGNDFAWGVMQEPLADGAVGKVRLAGVTWARVNVTSESHRFARPVAGSLTTLVSSSLGGAPILTKPSGTGVGMCQIRLESACDCPGDGSGSGGPVDDCMTCSGGAQAEYCTSFPGVTGDCSDGFTNTITLSYSTTCRWVGQANIATCTGEGFADSIGVQFYNDFATGSTIWEVVFNVPGTSPIYRVNAAGWDCNSPLTLTLVEGTDTFVHLVELTNWPATITVQPCGGGGSGAIEGLGLGTWSSGDDTTTTELTGAGVEVAAGSYLLVTLGLIQAESEDEFNTPPVVEWNGDALTPIAWQYEADGGDFTGLLLYGLHVTAGGTANIVATLASARVCVMHARQVTGLTDFAPDGTDGAGGTGLDQPLCAVTATKDAEWLTMSVFLKNLTTAYAWGTQFASAGQEVTVNVGGIEYRLTEGYRITSAAGTYVGTLDGSTQTLWAAAAGGVS